MDARLRASAWLVTAAVGAVLVLIPPRAAAQSPIKRVLIIHGGPESFPGTPEYDAALRRTLFSHPATQVEAHSEYLESEEFGDLAEASLRETIRIRYRERPIDLVIANTAPVLRFVLRHRDELFTNLPIVFAATAPPAEVLRGEVPAITGIVRNPLQAETLDMALRLHPRTTRVHVVAYAPAVEGFRQRTEASLAHFRARVRLSYDDSSSLAGALDVVRTLPRDSLLLFVRFTPRTEGRVLFPFEALPAFAEASPVPVYSAGTDTSLGLGIVGGVMRSGDGAGHLAAMALRILEGEKPKSILTQKQEAAPIFDWRQIKRWGLDPASLPPGSEVRFREPTVWELYGSYIIGTLVVVTAQLLLIAGLLQSRARLRRADDIIREREASLRVSYDRVRQMAGRLIHAQEAVRAEVARDLHDDVCQRLTSVSIGVSRLRNATGSLGDPSVKADIVGLDCETRDAFESLHRLSHDLHPATLRVLGLAPALRSHCQEIAARHGVQIQFSSADGIGTIHPDVAVCCFRIAQESLRNSVSHGGATHMTVTLGREGEVLDLTVADDGRGFDVAAVRNNGGGLGLVTMEERVNLVGGHMSIVSVPGQGTTVRARSPANPRPLNEASPAGVRFGAQPNVKANVSTPASMNSITH